MNLPGPVEKLVMVYYPAGILRRRCAPIETVDADVLALARRMIHLMHEAKGVGLAGPQVGVPRRLFVCNHTGDPADDRIWINPVLSASDGVVENEEGCLSIPGVTVLKRRAKEITVEGLDETGKVVSARAGDLLARIWQHEADHLDGRLVIDDMSEGSKIANRRALQSLEAGLPVGDG